MVARPVPGNTGATLDSINQLCDAADAAAAAIVDHGTRIDAVQGAVAAEADARNHAIGLEAQARSDAIGLEARAREQASAAEAQAREQGLVAEVHAREQGDAAEAKARENAISQEQRDRAAAVDALAARLTDVISDLEATLQQADQTEASARAAAVADLIKRVGDITTTVTGQRLDFTIYPGRPGDVPARYTFVTAAAALGGPRAALPFIPPALLANGDSGPVVRVGGSGIVGGRAACPLERGRLYRARYVVQRRVNPGDPTGDAVVCGIVYLDQSLRVVGGIVPVRAYPTLVTANGRQESEALISRTIGLGAAFQAPAAARFMVPVVAFYGPDALTDVEVLSVEDVTGAFVLSPPIANFEARLAALEGADLVGRLQVLESEVGTPGRMTFRSKGDATYATIPASVQIVELLGRQFEGDGGGGRYVRTSAQVAPGADSFTSHGAVFLRETVAADVVAGMLDSGYEAWLAGLPTEPPPESGKRWNDNGIPAVTP